MGRATERRGACVALVLALAGCGAREPAIAHAQNAPDFGPGSAEPPPRRPDAVVVEPPAAIPAPVSHAEARGVVTLREPESEAAVREVVQALADAWKHASLEGLAALLTRDARPIDGGRFSLVESWRQRLRAHDYARLEDAELVRPERIERWAWDELGEPGAPARPAGMRPDEVYVRVPLELTQIGGERLFGDAIVLLLRKEGGGYRIAAYGESDGR